MTALLSCSRHPSTHAPGGDDACPMCGLGEEKPRCECGHLTDEAVGYVPDAKAARENPGPHHTPIRCVLYRKRTCPTKETAP